MTPPKEIVFVGLNVGTFTGYGDRQSAKSLLRELNVTYPAGGPPNRTPVVNYSVRSMPTTIFFGADGLPFDRWYGAISEFRMNNIVSAMLEQTSQHLSCMCERIALRPFTIHFFHTEDEDTEILSSRGLQ